MSFKPGDKVRVRKNKRGETGPLGHYYTFYAGVLEVKKAFGCITVFRNNPFTGDYWGELSEDIFEKVPVITRELVTERLP